jgi:hypothetical protein
MAEQQNDFDLARLDEQIEHPASALDAPARHLVEDLERLYQAPAANTQANAASLRRVQSRLQAGVEARHREPAIMPLRGHARHREGTNLMHNDKSERKPAWHAFTHTLGTIAAVLVVALLVGSAGVLFYLKSHPNTQTGITGGPPVNVDCSHVFSDPAINHSADHGEHAVCQQKLETPLRNTVTVNGHKVTLISAYADYNRLLVRFAVVGTNGSVTQGGIYLNELITQDGERLSPTIGGGYYYDPQKQQTVYLDSFDTTSLPANLDTLSVSASFLAITSFAGSGSGDSASVNFSLPIQKAHHFATLQQSAAINGHQLTLSSIRVTPSMTMLSIKTDASLTPAQSWALEATMNGSTSTFITEDPPTAGKYDPIKGMLITSLEDFSNQPADKWVVHLISSGTPLGAGTLNIPFTF